MEIVKKRRYRNPRSSEENVCIKLKNARPPNARKCTYIKQGPTAFISNSVIIKLKNESALYIQSITV